MSDSYKIEKLVKLPPTPVKDGQPLWNGYYDVIAFTTGGIFYFTRISLYDWIEKNLQKYSVKVWKSKAKRKRNGIDQYNKLMMEISQDVNEWRSHHRQVIPGHGAGKQCVHRIYEQDLPAIKERVVMQMI